MRPKNAQDACRAHISGVQDGDFGVQSGQIIGYFRIVNGLDIVSD